jgi:asparagine synthase (glutamine-hydrolysing)
MCGIVGILGFKGSSEVVDEALIVKMRDTMVHRGPDGAGVHVSADRKLGLGHRRLSIIDLSTAAGQPMASGDGKLWLVFNGEIYNHAEIRKELQALSGRPWKTDHSDTEVILHAYEQWGIECIHRFRGMFAFALWDERQRELWLVRDRIGVKPLYYTVADGRLAFASEIKALLADGRQKREVNVEALFHYLSFLTSPAPQTFFEGIRKLPAGSLLRVTEDGRIEERRYWDVWDHAKRLEASEDEIAAMVLDELRTAVNYRKVSDVPCGVFLSGGIDSSTNTALFSEGGGTVKTFTIGYSGDTGGYENELDHARRMAELVHADHHERLLGVEDLLSFLPRMIHLQDEPIGDPVCVPVYYVSELARRNGVTVCQLGEGADELFWGYPYWKRMLKLQELGALPVPRFLKRAALPLVGLWQGKSSRPYEWLRRSADGVPIFWGGSEAFPEGHKRALLSPALQKRFEGFSSYDVLRPIRERFEEKAWEKSHLNWMSYLDLNLRLPELLLMRVDKMSMGVGLEGRVPFLDHKFVELAMSIPSAMKTKDGNLKYLLKKAVRGVIPDDLIDRKKQGFGVPVHQWIFERWGDVARRELESFCDDSGYFDKRQVMALIREGQGTQVWFLLNFALWWRHFIKGEEIAGMA